MDPTVEDTSARLDRLLDETVLPWWRSVCAAGDGGFRLGHDTAGRPLPVERVHLVSQARLVWVAARLRRRGIDPEFWEPVARRGLAFLLGRLADARSGGFHWSVAVDPQRPVEPGKHLYGQAFALLALVEAAEVIEDAAAARAAAALWAVLERHAHDAEHGGYRECFTRDWRVPTGKSWSPLGEPVGSKLANTHLHLMEAVRAYAEWSGDETARRRLSELGLIVAVTIRHGGAHLPVDLHTGDWQPQPDATAPASYGHAIEIAWLLPRAVRAAGMSPALVRDRCDGIAHAVLRFGFDDRAGGVFRAGPLDAAATRLEKDWWVQAEALAGFLDRFRAGGDPAFATAYRRTLDWIETRQVDRENGEWHRLVSADGIPQGRKADCWKCPFHQVRALLHCRDLLAAPDRGPLPG